MDQVPGRHMRYPYTWTAKFIQFPYKYQYNTSFPFRYMIYSTGLTMLIYWQLNKFIMTPANKEYTEKKRAEERHYHYKRP